MMKKVLCILLSLWTSVSLAQSMVMDSLHDEVNIIAGYLDSKAVIVRWVPSTPAVSVSYTHLTLPTNREV